MNEIKVINGDIVQVELPDYSGKAGFVKAPSGISLAYRPNKRGASEAGSEITIGDERFTITAVEASTVVSGFRVLRLAPVE